MSEASGVHRRLVADIGGTNARFAVSSGAGAFEAVHTLRVADYAGIGEAVAAYRALIGIEAPFAEAAVAAAGPVEAGAIRMTNCPWIVRVDDLKFALKPGGSTSLFNDLQAVALALPHLAPHGVEVLRPAGDPVFAPVRLAVNVGTGFGAAAAHPTDAGWHASASEAGHMTFAAAQVDEGGMLPDGGSVEDVLSGPGFAALYARLTAKGAGAKTPAEVFAALGHDAVADRALRLFTEYLGRIAGDLALAHAVGGGVFLCGGLANRWRSVADLDAFFAAFDAKGSMTARMRNVPVYRITADQPALLGLSHASLR